MPSDGAGPIPCPPPGVYPGVANEEYQRWDAVSSSQLNRILNRTPAHMRYEVDHPEPPTESLVEGDAIHLAVLQPSLFDARYVEGIQVDRRTKEGKAAWEEFLKTAAGRKVLTPLQAEKVRGTSGRVLGYKPAQAVLGGPGDVEVSFVWIDRATGVRCRGRADKLAFEFMAVADLKSTGDASEESFKKSIKKYGYHRQLSFYQDGLRENGIDLPFAIIIAVEKDPPYEPAVYRVDDLALDDGRVGFRRALTAYARCLDSGHWVGYGDEIVDISLPPWGWEGI